MKFHVNGLLNYNQTQKQMWVVRLWYLHFVTVAEKSEHILEFCRGNNRTYSNIPEAGLAFQRMKNSCAY